MNKKLLNLFLGLFLVLSMTSCYTYKYSVGDGAQKGIEVKEKNHYVINGLVPVDTSSPVDMAGNEENYDVKVEFSFVDGLISAITFGLYSPSTTTVTK